MIKYIRNAIAKRREQVQECRFQDGYGFAFTAHLHLGIPLDKIFDQAYDPWDDDPFDAGVVAGCRKLEQLTANSV